MALAQHHDRAGLIKALLLVSVVGVHAALLAGILASARVTVLVKAPEPTDVRFVEISPDISQTAPAPVAPQPKSQPKPEPTPEPQAAPESTPPEPEPEPIAPAPDAITLPPPEIAPEPVAQPQPKPEIKPEPKPRSKSKPRPKPKAKPEPRSQPELKSISPKPETAQTPTTAAAQGPAVAATAPASKPASNQPRLIGKVDYLGSRPHPDYPRVSMRRGETGRVVVRVVISRQGLVEKATVRTSSGFSRLDESAVNAVRAARFKPYTENGVPYPAIADIPFDFVL